MHAAEEAVDRRTGASLGLLTAFVLLLSAAATALTTRHVHLTALTGMLAGSAVVAGLAASRATTESAISASFIVALLAAAFLGPAETVVMCLLSEATAAALAKTKIRWIAVNLVVAIAPALAMALSLRAIAPADQRALSFYLILACAGALSLAMSFAIHFEYQRRLHAIEPWSLEMIRDFVPSLAVNTVLAVAGASLYVELGLSGIAFALTAVAAFAYMAQLVSTARRRSQEYVSLSWGVLAGLLRALDTRDGRAARHAAAVARFSADIARAVGMDGRQVELAHTAGLLHDIGHFALSDRVAERGRTLTEEDWEAIHRHPELGADMLRDLGMYGPVAEIVRAHHERLDGLGYPDGLIADQIPEIAKIIAVAEAYDTLTASDSYRTAVSSFEALTELHRHAGAQFDPRYVTVLGQLLGGEGARYRHADHADFDTELAMERRIIEAAS